jgi:membrane protein
MLISFLVSAFINYEGCRTDMTSQNMKPMPAWKEKILPYYQRANHLSRGTLEVIRVTIKHFSLSRGSEAAATMAYYAIFSLFPLLLVLISVAGFILKNQSAYDAVLEFILNILPNARSLLIRNVDVILNRSGTIGLIGLAGSIWSASGFFSAFVRHINAAWHTVKPSGFIRTRLLALAMIAMLVLLLLLSLVSSSLINLIKLANLLLPTGETLEHTPLWPWVQAFIPGVFTFLMFIVMFRYIPGKRVRWRACLLGALWTSIAWELGKRLFMFYLGSGLARYEIIYGSLGTVLALLFWIYVSCLIILLGAHLTATIDQRNPRPKKKKSELSPA